MSYTTDTLLNAYQTRVAQTEIDTGIYGAIPFVMEQNLFAGLSVMDQQKILTANGQSVDISAINENTPTVYTSFSFDIDPNRNDTAKTRVTIYTFWTGFYFNKYDFAGNAVAAEQYLVNKFVESDNALASAISTQLINIIDTRKTQVFTATGMPTGMTFNTGSDSVTIAAALQGKRFFDYMDTSFMVNKLKGEKTVLASPSLGYTLSDHQLYGVANEKNVLGQNYPMTKVDNNLAPTASSQATFYEMTKGAISMWESIPAEFMARDNSVPGVKYDVGSTPLPLTGLKPLTIVQDEKYDNNGLTPRPTDGATVVQKWGIGHSFGVVTSYNSDLTTRTNDTVKVELTTA